MQVQVIEAITKDLFSPIRENGSLEVGFSILENGNIQYLSQSSQAGSLGYFKTRIVWDKQTGKRVQEQKGYNT